MLDVADKTLLIEDSQRELDEIRRKLRGTEYYETLTETPEEIKLLKTQTPKAISYRFNSKAFRALKQFRLKIDNNSCSRIKDNGVCGSTERLALHHTCYDRYYNEHLNDVMIMCTKCHEEGHSVTNETINAINPIKKFNNNITNPKSKEDQMTIRKVKKTKKEKKDIIEIWLNDYLVNPNSANTDKVVANKCGLSPQGVKNIRDSVGFKKCKVCKLTASGRRSAGGKEPKITPSKFLQLVELEGKDAAISHVLDVLFFVKPTKQTHVTTATPIIDKTVKQVIDVAPLQLDEPKQFNKLDEKSLKQKVETFAEVVSQLQLKGVEFDVDVTLCNFIASVIN